MQAYKDRDILLLELGFRSYTDYLNSSLWMGIRHRCFKTMPNCCICSQETEVIHHRRYDRDILLGKSAAGLIPLCHTCHDVIELDGRKKLSLEEANTKLDRLICKVKKITQPIVYKYKHGNQIKCNKCKNKWRTILADSLQCPKCGYIGVVYKQRNKYKLGSDRIATRKGNFRLTNAKLGV